MTLENLVGRTLEAITPMRVDIQQLLAILASQSLLIKISR